MDIGLLGKLLGRDQHWHGACTVILDADATVQTVGTDAIMSGGAKMYAPRTSSGRIHGDSVCLLQDGTALVILQITKTRGQSGEEHVKQSLVVADTAHVVALEFADVSVIGNLGLALPEARTGSHHGTQKRQSLHG